MTDAAGAALDQLVDLLGIERSAASRLLSEVNGVVEDAVALHFAGGGGAGAGGASGASGAAPSMRESKLRQLRAILGPEGTDDQLRVLLAQNASSVERAVDHFFSSGLPAARSAQPRQRGGSGGGRAGNEPAASGDRTGRAAELVIIGACLQHRL
jgi:hypothetical protein